MLIAGGSSDGTSGGALKTAEIYDFTGGTFTPSNSTLNAARFKGTATLLPSGMVLLVGGTTSQTAELYDADSDKFDLTGSAVQADPSLTATLLNNGQVLITGLTTGGTPQTDTELYTPSFDPLGTVGLTSSDTSAMPDSFGGPCVLTINGGGVSKCSSMVTPAEVGTSPHTITGSYPADAVHSSSSGTASLTVNKADTTTSVATSVNPSTYGQAVTFKGTVTVNSPGSGTPSGTITFYDGSNAISGAVTIAVATCLTGTPSNSACATFTTSAQQLAAGSHSITAVYSGDANFKRHRVGHGKHCNSTDSGR